MLEMFESWTPKGLAYLRFNGKPITILHLLTGGCNASRKYHGFGDFLRLDSPGLCLYEKEASIYFKSIVGSSRAPVILGVANLQRRQFHDYAVRDLKFWQFRANHESKTIKPRRTSLLAKLHLN